MTIDRLAAALSVEPGELTNEGGVTILEDPVPHEAAEQAVSGVRPYNNESGSF